MSSHDQERLHATSGRKPRHFTPCEVPMARPPTAPRSPGPDAVYIGTTWGRLHGQQPAGRLRHLLGRRRPGEPCPVHRAGIGTAGGPDRVRRPVEITSRRRRLPGSRTHRDGRGLADDPESRLRATKPLSARRPLRSSWSSAWTARRGHDQLGGNVSTIHGEQPTSPRWTTSRSRTTAGGSSRACRSGGRSVKVKKPATLSAPRPRRDGEGDVGATSARRDRTVNVGVRVRSGCSPARNPIARHFV